MRKSSMICAAATLLASAASASAQYFAPFGNPGVLTAPEAASGAFGAGAARSATQQQLCTQSSGRDGPRTLCYYADPPPNGRR